MPMAALAWAMVRSAAAMSGRRSSYSDGTPTGIGGGAIVMGFTGIEKSEAASADQGCDCVLDIVRARRRC